MNDDRREACTTNAAGSIVSGSKVAHEGEIYIVGQVKGNEKKTNEDYDSLIAQKYTPCGHCNPN